ncbi:MAG TPA: hypothetical protein VE956_10415 [Nodularia sp. (in: cyanobacteria)]|nr:hypothetical protein [Nodularia sp. (in: cyanobacteria)]
MQIQQSVTSLSQRNKILLATLTLLIFNLLVSLLVVNPIISRLYSGESFFILKPLSGRAENPLDFYLLRYIQFFIAFNLLGCFSLIGAVSSVKYFRQMRNSFNYANISHNFIAGMKKNLLPDRDWKLIVATICIPITFFVIYLILGLQISPSFNAFEYFGADIGEQINGWTSMEWNLNHKGSHPLILLFVDFIGSGIHQLISSKVLTVLLLNAFFASLAVFLAFIFFRLVLGKFIDATLLTLVFGFSMSQLVFGAIPETYAFAAASIIATHILFFICLRDKKLYTEYWVLTGLFTFGITITNFAQSIICFSIVVILLRRKDRLAIVAEYIGVVVLICFLLSLIQYKIFNTAALFFVPSTVVTELKYTAIKIINQPLTTLYELGKHFFIVNFVTASPLPLAEEILTRRPIIGFFQRPLNYNFAGLVGIVLWLSIFISGLFKNIQMIHQNRPMFYGLFLCILFNIALHSVFGVNEMFLYTCHFTFLVLAIVTNLSLIKNRSYKAGLVALIVLMGTNNLWVMKQIIEAATTLSNNTL